LKVLPCSLLAMCLGLVLQILDVFLELVKVAALLLELLLELLETLLFLFSYPKTLFGLFALIEGITVQCISWSVFGRKDIAYPDLTPPGLTPPVSPSAARKAETVNERRTDGVALASLTTCVRIILSSL
jgi:hypothetical protein